MNSRYKDKLVGVYAPSSHGHTSVLGQTQEFSKWFWANHTLVNMHQFGYEVEKEKRYTVTIKAVLGQYLGRYYLNDEELTPQFSRTQFTGDGERPAFTRKELEDTGFGWVFDCPGVEVKEVTDEKPNY